MPFRQRLDGQIEPLTDLRWKAATAAQRKAFYSAAGDVALARLKTQLSRGIGANGRAMKPRIRAVLPDGASGPVMIPHEMRSRAITLSDYSATDRGLLIWWHGGTGHRTHRAARARAKAKKAAKKPPPFGEILSYHADGLVHHAPVRDVRLSRASIAQIRLEMRKWFNEHQPKATPKPTGKPQPPQAPTHPFPPLHRPPLRRLPAAQPPRPQATVKSVTAPPARPIERTVNGLGFTRDTTSKRRNDRVITANVGRLERQFKVNPNVYVAPGGVGRNTNSASYADALQSIANALENGQPLDMPTVHVDSSGHVSFGDGRYQFAALRDLGFTHLPVAAQLHDAIGVNRLVGGYSPVNRGQRLVRTTATIGAIAAALAALSGAAATSDGWSGVLDVFQGLADLFGGDSGQ